MTLRGGEEESCEQWGWDALSRGSLLACPTPGSPGVVEAVPLAGHGALAVGCVMSPHGGARVVGDGVEVVNGVVCGEQACCSALLPPKVPAQSPPTTPAAPAPWIPCLPPLTPLPRTTRGQEEPRSHQELRAGTRGMQGLGLTAALRGEFPEVQVLQREVDEGGEFAASYPGLGEALQVWRVPSRSQGTKGSLQ